MQYRIEGNDFLSLIIMGDETWVHHFTPETKRASMEWRHTSLPAWNKFKGGTISLWPVAILHFTMAGCDIAFGPKFHSECLCSLDVLPTRFTLSRVQHFWSKFPVDVTFHSHTVMNL